MSQQNLQKGSSLDFVQVPSGWLLGMHRRSLSDDVTLDVGSAPMQVMDPDGEGRDVTLPDASGEDKGVHGLTFVVMNTADAAEDLTVKDGKSDSTVATVGEGDTGIFVWDDDAEEWLGNSL